MSYNLEFYKLGWKEMTEDVQLFIAESGATQ